MNNFALSLGMMNDVLLVIILISLAIASLWNPSLFTSTLMFMCYGLIMAIVWVKLRAPDIALAEAALGAGITGALLLYTLSKLNFSSLDLQSQPNLKTTGETKRTLLLGVFFLVLSGVGICWLLLTQSVVPATLSSMLQQNLPESGVKNPVTAVLINFRAYDTLLEMAVLMTALLASWALQPLTLTKQTSSTPFLISLLAISLPLLVFSAFYLLWRGADYPGGAFQAGTVLAGALVLLLLAEVWQQIPLTIWYWRLSITLGLLSMILVGASNAFSGGHFLQYSSPSMQILLIEMAAMFAIAVTLASLIQLGRHQFESTAD